MPNCRAYLVFSRGQPQNFIASAPTMGPMGVPLKRRSRTSKAQNVESDVPAGSEHRDEAAIDVMPERQARAADRLSVGTAYCCTQEPWEGRLGSLLFRSA
jgi:hypothetical protein